MPPVDLREMEQDAQNPLYVRGVILNPADVLALIAALRKATAALGKELHDACFNDECATCPGCIALREIAALVSDGEASDA